MKNIRNKTLTEEEIKEEGEKRMKILLSNYPKREHATLLRFHNDLRQIEYWMSEKLSKSQRLTKCKEK